VPHTIKALQKTCFPEVPSKVNVYEQFGIKRSYWPMLKIGIIFK